MEASHKGKTEKKLTTKMSRPPQRLSSILPLGVLFTMFPKFTT